jgi:WD40 repeat protein
MENGRLALKAWDLEALQERQLLASDKPGEILALAVAQANEKTLLAAAVDAEPISPTRRYLAFWEPFRDAGTIPCPQVRTLALSPDGARLSSAGGAPKGLENPQGPLPRAWLPFGDAARVSQVAYAPDGKTLACGTIDGTVQIWHLENGQLLGQKGHHRGEISALTFTADGHRLASADLDGRVVLWDAAGARLLKQGQVPGSVLSLAFDPAGERLAWGNANGTIYVLRLAPE